MGGVVELVGEVCVGVYDEVDGGGGGGCFWGVFFWGGWRRGVGGEGRRRVCMFELGDGKGVVFLGFEIGKM